MIIAALDIGSNSIHLVVVETGHEKPFRVVASAKEVVRLGRSAARDQRLSATAMERAIDCLKRFRLVAESHGADELIAVATSAVREASNRDQFLARAAEEAGIDIDMLSGIEEARLIALAVSVRHKQRSGRQALVIDIGGGSTELAVMKSGEPIALTSFKLGAVRLAEQFVKSDPIGESQLQRLRMELRDTIADRASEIEAAGYEVCYGTSGTINALATLNLRRRIAEGGNRASRRRLEHSLTIDELRALNKELAAYSLEECVRVARLNRQRAEIIVPGGQLLEALMEKLKVDELVSCDWALREGVIIASFSRRVETVTTSPAQLERDPSLRGALALTRHYRADLKHAHRVAYLAQQLFDELRPLHSLGGEHRRLLAAAALLHDIGYFVSHTGHHQHSAYLIQNSDLVGFTASEVSVIANVAYYHRGPIKSKRDHFSDLRAQDREIVQKLAALLRLADALDRDHKGRVRSLRCEVGDDEVRIVALCTREAETMRRRLEERADMFSDVFGRKVVLLATPSAAEYDELML